MGYLTILVPETQLRLGGDIVLMTPLADDAYLQYEHYAAYMDGPRYWVSSYAVLTRPVAAYLQLLHLGQGRWTADEVAAVIHSAHLYLRRALGLTWCAPVTSSPALVATRTVQLLPRQPPVPRQPPATKMRTRRA